MIQSNQLFKIKTENGLVAETPEGSEIYVHVTDNGNGTHAINGKVVLAAEQSTQELGWVRTNETLPSNTANLLEAAHDIVIAELKVLNPSVEFIKVL